VLNSGRTSNPPACEEVKGGSDGDQPGTAIAAVSAFGKNCDPDVTWQIQEPAFELPNHFLFNGVKEDTKWLAF
jgi:hypothetical protein